MALSVAKDFSFVISLCPHEYILYLLIVYHGMSYGYFVLSQFIKKIKATSEIFSVVLRESVL